MKRGKRKETKPRSRSTALAVTRQPAPDAAAADGPPLVAQPHGGQLRRGNPGNKGGGRPPSWLRQQMREALEAALPKIREVVNTRRDPVTGEEVTRVEWLKCLDLLAKYGLGSQVDLSGADGAPFTVAVLTAQAAGRQATTAD